MNERSSNIAVISSNPENGYFARLLWVMQEESLKSDRCMEIYLIQSAVKIGGIDYLYDKIAREKRAGAVITLAHQTGQKSLWLMMEAGIIPVMVDAPTCGVHNINTDNKTGAHAAVKHLLDSGRKKIGLVIGDHVNVAVQRERYEGYRLALDKKSVPFREGLIWNVKKFDYRDGKEAFRFMISSDVDAVFCAAGDYTAHGFLNEARMEHVDVPGNIALVGFDDIQMSADTGLTTVRQPLDEIGKEAVRLAVAGMENPGLPPQNKIFENKLIIRETA